MKKIMLFQPPETHTCSYLEEQQSRSLYVDPRAELDNETLTLLSQNGFRRSGRLLYRPDCPSCSACIPVRLRVADFTPSRSQRRIINKNTDIELQIQAPSDSDELFRLFEQYINTHHADGDMYPPSRRQYRDFLVSDFGTTRLMTARLQGELVACMVFDQLQDGLSAVYCFYSDQWPQRSLGTFMILRLSQLCLANKRPFNYLGYLVSGCRKMNYKRQFMPLEAYQNGQWLLWND